MVVAERGVEFPDARGILTCLWPEALSFFLYFILGLGVCSQLFKSSKT